MLSNKLINKAVFVLWFIAMLSFCDIGIVKAQELDMVHQLLRERGLLVSNVAYSWRGSYPFDLDLWVQSNYSMVDLGQGRMNVNPSEFYELYWVLQGNDVNELTPDPCVAPGDDGPYSYRLYYKISSEPHITANFSTDVPDMNVLNDLASKYAATRAAYPNVPVTTQLRGGPSFLVNYADSAIQTYIDTVQPDILAHAGYYFFDGTSPDPHHEIYFERLEQWREVAIDNNLPYSMYVQTFYGVDNLRIPSESDVRFNIFTGMAYGYKIIHHFIYDGWGASNPVPTPVLFSDVQGTANPTGLFYETAAANTEALNIGSALVYLQSTAPRYVTGTPGAALPTRTVRWQAGEIEPYISAVEVNEVSPDDVVIGYFEPMLESDDGPEFTNQIYFAVTNCRHGKNISANAGTQSVKLSFDFGSSGITSLQRLNRYTGQVEVISADGSYDDITYQQTGPSTYEMYIDLPGGTGDLFKFNTGAFFVNGASCGDFDTLKGDLNSDCAVDFADFAILAEGWLYCNNPENEQCTVDCSDPQYQDICN